VSIAAITIRIVAIIALNRVGNSYSVSANLQAFFGVVIVEETSSSSTLNAMNCL
jgi:hypothetical protein